MEHQQGRNWKIGTVVQGDMSQVSAAGEYLIHDTIYAYRILCRDTSLITLGIPDDSLYQNFYSKARAENYGKFEQANQYALNGDFASAIAINEAISTNSVIELNQKMVNEILFHQLKLQSDTTQDRKYVYSQNQYTILNNIAIQNPLSGGGAVYQARTMLWIDPVNPIHGGDNANQFQIRPSEIKVSDYKLYPNPNTGIMTIEYKIEASENAVFSIYDMSGRLVKQQILNAQNSTAFIDAAMLNAGVYYYIIKEGNTNAKTEKLIIIK